MDSDASGVPFIWAGLPVHDEAGEEGVGFVVEGSAKSMSLKHSGADEEICTDVQRDGLSVRRARVAGKRSKPGVDASRITNG